MYLQALHMFRQINCHPQGVLSRNCQVLIAFFCCKTNYCVFECNKYLKFLDNTPDNGNLFAGTYLGVVNTFYTC